MAEATPKELSPEEQRRVDAGKANAVREKAALKDGGGPKVVTTDALTGKSTTKTL